MRMTGIGTLMLVSAFAVGGATLRAATMTLEGTVSDAKCGAKHAMKDAAACTKACVDKGSDYALVVGTKVYTLKTSSDKDKMKLGRLAGKMAMVMGDVFNEYTLVPTTSA